MFFVTRVPSEPLSFRARTKADCPVESLILFRGVVEFRQEATALKSYVDVQRLRSDQSLKHAVVILQESMRNFVKHSENVTK